MSNPTRPVPGRVRTGFSHVFVSEFSRSGNTVTYSNGVRLGRAKKIEVSANVADGKYYADNGVAEGDNPIFLSGTAKVTIDGAWTEVRQMTLGLSRTKEITIGEGASAKTVEVTAYGKDQNVPEMGIGWVEEYRAGGSNFWIAKVLLRVQFKTPGDNAETREESINWQSEEMEMNIFRDGTDNDDYKYESEELSSLSDAIDVVKAILNIA